MFGLLNAKLIAASDEGLRSQVEKEFLAAAGGEGSEGEGSTRTGSTNPRKITENLIGQRDQAQALLEAYSRYYGGENGVGGIDTSTDPNGARHVDKNIQEIQSYVNALNARIERFQSASDDQDRNLLIYSENMQTLYPEGYKKIMASGARTLLGHLVTASRLGGKVSDKAIGRWAEAAGYMPGTASLADLIGRSGVDMQARTWSRLLSANHAEELQKAAGKKNERETHQKFQDFLETGKWNQEGEQVADPTEELQKTLAGALTEQGAQGIIDSMRKELENQQRYLGKGSQERMAKLMGGAAAEMQQAAEFYTLREKLQKEVPDYTEQYAAMIAEVKGVYGSATIPEYRPGSDPADLDNVIYSIQESFPTLEERFGAVDKAWQSIAAGKPKLMELWGKLPLYNRAKVYTDARMRVGKDLDFNQILGLRGVDLSSTDELATYFGEKGLFAQRVAEAQAMQSAWAQANQATADAEPLETQRRLRDMKRGIEMRTLVKRLGDDSIEWTKQGGHLVTIDGRPIGEGREDLFYTTPTGIQGLRKAAEQHNAEIEARTTAGGKLIAGLQSADKRSPFQSMSDVYQTLDTMSPGMATAVQEYASIINNLGELRDQRGADAETRRAQLRDMLNQVILAREFPEPVYQDMLKYLSGVETDIGRRVARRTKPARVEMGREALREAGDGVYTRHGGGFMSGTVQIESGNRQEYVVPAEAADTFRSAVPQLQDLLTRMLDQGGGDMMSVDARQFREGGMQATISGSIRHDGKVVLELGVGVEEVLQQIAAMLQPKPKDEPKVGDKVFSPLVGG